MRADAESEAALLDVLDRFCSAFAERDADEVLRRRSLAPYADPRLVAALTRCSWRSRLDEALRAL